MEFVTVDKLGRILLPKALREELHIKPGTRLLAVPADGKLVLQEIDLEALAKQMAKEFEGVDIDRIARESRRQANLDAADAFERILGRREPRGGRNAPPARDHGKSATARPPRNKSRD